MKKLIITNILLLLFLAFNVNAQGFRTCASWDTFCKNPAQIVATKCRLGVPVKHDQCRALGLPDRYMVRGGGSLVDGLMDFDLFDYIERSESGNSRAN